MWRSVILWVCLAGLSVQPVRADEPPKSLDSRLKIELFAEHPQIVTPTGLDVDHRGRRRQPLPWPLRLSPGRK